MKNCLNCGVKFTPKNPKGKYCSNKCKVYAHRGVKVIRKDEPESPHKEPEVTVHNLNTPTSEIKPQEAPKTNYTINTKPQPEDGLDEMERLFQSIDLNNTKK